MTTIKAGYRLTVTSWENDGDHYNTKVSEGWTKDEVAFLVPFIKTTCDLLGNEYEPEDSVIEKATSKILKVVDDHPSVHESDKLKCYFTPATEDEKSSEYYSPLEGVSELIYDFVGSSECSWTRVCESIKVEYIPQDIMIRDVTAQFN